MCSLVNIFAVKWYGESEFWLALGKVLLIVGLIIYTFITMLGGNPLHDRFGFRYWKDPGSFAELYKTGSLGRFLGFLQCLILAAFTIAGPDYVSMAAGEAENPRYVMPRAYKAVFYRLTSFFVLGSLAVGINAPHDDPELSAAFGNDAPGAAASPYVVAMNRLRIRVLPDIVNAMVLGSAFSAGNSYVYCASRSLYGLALEGKAPRILTKCTRNGVPVYCVAIVLLISLLSFLQVSNGASTVLSWFVNLVGHLPQQSSSSPTVLLAQLSNSLGFHLAHMLTRFLGDSLPADQFLCHGLHLSRLPPRLSCPVCRSGDSSLYILAPAICGILRIRLLFRDDLCRWLPGLPARQLECADFPVQLHDGCGVSVSLCWMEAIEADEGGEAGGVRFGDWGRAGGGGKISARLCAGEAEVSLFVDLSCSVFCFSCACFASGAIFKVVLPCEVEGCDTVLFDRDFSGLASRILTTSTC